MAGMKISSGKKSLFLWWNGSIADVRGGGGEEGKRLLVFLIYCCGHTNNPAVVNNSLSSFINLLNKSISRRPLSACLCLK